MDLNIYNVIVRPILTTKARQLGNRNKQLVLEVHPHANKPMVVRALKMLFNVDVATIRSSVDKGKRRLVGRRVVEPVVSKRMYVTLKGDQALNQVGDLAVAGSMPSSTDTQNV